MDDRLSAMGYGRGCVCLTGSEVVLNGREQRARQLTGRQRRVTVRASSHFISPLEIFAYPLRRRVRADTTRLIIHHAARYTVTQAFGDDIVYRIKNLFEKENRKEANAGGT
ncbi:hypothetical protein NKI54_35030 [Mesorhizobium sp. M0663]|uniref:hypothetical protein n=1 Tax=Mesorhizobium sp. M0663 TaxID=2956981 RepID=UPI00333CBCF0